MSLKNPECDGSACGGPGEVRILPLGREANLHVCRACYDVEMDARQRRFQRGCYQQELPAWESLQVKT